MDRVDDAAAADELQRISGLTVREAALEGLMIADDDEAVLELYRSSNDPAEKRELLQMLVNMDSEAVWSIIDETLEDGQ